MNKHIGIILLLFINIPHADARSPYRETVGFQVTWDVGYGSNVYVVGSHPDVGSWSPTNNAVKLRWTAGNVWTGQIGIQAGTVLEYKFIARHAASNRYCDAANVLWEPGPNRTNMVAAQPAAAYTGKTVFYYSTWTNVSIVYRDGASFTGKTMTTAGAGRFGGEYLYRVDRIGEAGEALEFVCNGYAGGGVLWDNPLYSDFNNNYYTDLDVFLLQDKQIYNYWPPATVTGPRLLTNWVNSTAPGIPGRNIRIYLPRGYDTNTWKRYPVLYMHDGQNIFAGSVVPGESPANQWNLDEIATKEISQGRMRECIIVGMDKSITNRGREYTPTNDFVTGEGQGMANQHMKFVVDNVRPTLDYNYRTLNDRGNTLVGGSSRGGLSSIYLTYDTNVFGGMLAMSPSLTRAPNYTAALYGKAKPNARLYLDTGTDEHLQIPDADYWNKPWEGYDIFLGHGCVVNRDLLMRIGCGAGHDELAWRARLPAALRYLLPAREEPNALAIQEHAPTMTVAQAGPAERIRFSAFALQDQRYIVQRTGNLTGNFWSNTVATVQRMPWGEIALTNDAGEWTTPVFFRWAVSPAFDK